MSYTAWYIKGEIHSSCTKTQESYKYGVVLNITKGILQDQNTIFIATYLPPEGSKVYSTDENEANGILILEELICKIKSQYVCYSFFNYQ